MIPLVFKVFLIDFTCHDDHLSCNVPRWQLLWKTSTKAFRGQSARLFRQNRPFSLLKQIFNWFTAYGSLENNHAIKTICHTTFCGKLSIRCWNWKSHVTRTWSLCRTFIGNYHQRLTIFINECFKCIWKPWLGMKSR